MSMTSGERIAVIASVGQTVAFVLKTTFRIRVIFFIFVGCVFAFSHTCLYLLWVMVSDNDEPGQYSKDCFGALVTTYLVMTVAPGSKS
ncbi:hypothetical protein BG005_005942 [Podila minutissima]|nr:hypothetical protein BG005_005942 [Podila minutissima]